jgi:hypothetical protein
MKRLGMFNKEINKYLLYILLFCLQVSCKGQTKNNTNQEKSVDTISCNEKLKNLITACSNFDNPFKNNLSALIDNNDGNIYLIKLYTNDSGEDSKNTIGWIRLNLDNNTLTDITDDTEGGNTLKYDKTLYNKYLTECLGINPVEKITESNATDKKEKICELPIDYDDYYSVCIYPCDTKKCQERYPKYSIANDNNLALLLKQNKYELPEEYILLPMVNKTVQPVILCYTESDIEQYVLITIQNDRIISRLQIGEMKDNGSTWFYIDKNFKIIIYKGDRKNIWKTFKMADNGNFLSL